MMGAEDHAIAPFERLIGGEWHGGELSGLRSYFATDEAPVLVGEGAWF